MRLTKVFFLTIFFFLIFCGISHSSANHVKAAEIIFQDDFSTDLSKWEKTNPGDGSSWNIVDGMASPVFIQNNTITQLVPNDVSWNNSFQIIAIDFDYKYIFGPDQNFLIRYRGLNDFYELHFNGSMNVERTIPSFLTKLSNYSPFANDLHHVRIEYYLSSIRIYIDGSLKMSIDDPTNPYSDGKIGLRVASGNSVFFDNIVVTTLDPLPTPTPTPSPTPTPTPVVFPSYSQRDPLWKDDTYDQARQWSPRNPTFERWGCAVTSASMVMNYHGITLLPNGQSSNPGRLNSWLKMQADGFLRTGHLNWEAVARATRLVSLTHPLWPRLEFAWGEADGAQLHEELIAGRPTILEEPGHFIAAYQYNSPTDIDIRDPFYPTRTKLSDYGHSFLSTRKFTPSFTNLGYIIATADPNITLELEKKDGNIFLPVGDARFFTQEPIIDQISGSSARAESFRVLEYPKPASGEYRLKIIRNPRSRGVVDIYLYDQDGNPTLGKRVLQQRKSPEFVYFSFNLDGKSKIKKSHKEWDDDTKWDDD